MSLFGCTLVGSLFIPGQRPLRLLTSRRCPTPLPHEIKHGKRLWIAGTAPLVNAELQTTSYQFQGRNARHAIHATGHGRPRRQASRQNSPISRKSYSSVPGSDAGSVGPPGLEWRSGARAGSSSSRIVSTGSPSSVTSRPCYHAQSPRFPGASGCPLCWAVIRVFLRAYPQATGRRPRTLPISSRPPLFCMYSFNLLGRDALVPDGGLQRVRPC